LREEVLKICSNDILIPILTREAHDELLREAKESVLKARSFFIGFYLARKR
jgi:hypothetical protein